MKASPFLSLGKLFLNMSCLALGEISGGDTPWFSFLTP